MLKSMPGKLLGNTTWSLITFRYKSTIFIIVPEAWYLVWLHEGLYLTTCRNWKILGVWSPFWMYQYMLEVFLRWPLRKGGGHTWIYWYTLLSGFDPFSETNQVVFRPSIIISRSCLTNITKKTSACRSLDSGRGSTIHISFVFQQKSQHVPG